MPNIVSPVQNSPSPIIPTATATKVPTLTATLKPTRTPTPEPTLTPTATPKPILIAYSERGGDGVSEAYCLRQYGSYSFVLYEDGQLIIFSKDGLVEKTLTQKEINALLARIDKTGYFQVESNGEMDQNDTIYEIREKIQVPDGDASKQITVKDKTFWIYNPLWDYLVEPIKQTIKIIWNYQPAGMTPYIPEKMDLMIFALSSNTSESDFDIATPIPPIAEWPSELEPLAKMRYRNEFVFIPLNSQETPSILKLFSQFPSGRIFTQYGFKYYVVTCPILP